MNQHNINMELIGRIAGITDALNATMDVVTTLGKNIDEMIRTINEVHQTTCINLLALKQVLIDNGLITSHEEWMKTFSRTTHEFDQRLAKRLDQRD